MLLLGVLTGVLLGVGAYTFHFAEGLSYLSSDPAACANCHIMQSQFESWQKSSHHAVAKCIDCHLPHDFIGKYIAKAENGYRHSKEFTAQTFPEPIMIRARGREILQENCVACHNGLVHQLAAGPRGSADAPDCVHCHLSVGHGERAGLGGPLHYPPDSSPQSRDTRNGT